MIIEDLFAATNMAIKDLSPKLLYTLSAEKDEHGYNMNEVDWNTFVIASENTAPVPTKEEILAKRAEIVITLPMQRLRAERNRRLNASDWIVAKSAEKGEPVPPEWVSYRQTLRDITSNYTSLEDVVWPVSP